MWQVLISAMYHDYTITNNNPKNTLLQSAEIRCLLKPTSQKSEILFNTCEIKGAERSIDRERVRAREWERERERERERCKQKCWNNCVCLLVYKDKWFRQKPMLSSTEIEITKIKLNKIENTIFCFNMSVYVKIKIISTHSFVLTYRFSFNATLVFKQLTQ